MRPRALILCAFMLLALAVPSFAHSGGTDGNGGHYNRSTGEYHYHHGYPAHQHTDGICPYDYDDKTGENSGSSSPKKAAPDTAEKSSIKKESMFTAAILPFIEMVFWIIVDNILLILGLSAIYYAGKGILHIIKSMRK